MGGTLEQGLGIWCCLCEGKKVYVCVTLSVQYIQGLSMDQCRERERDTHTEKGRERER